ncbi:MULTISPECIES: ABC transporter substrate-binding protein [unclassified Neisseria]|uniref:ABC transporter substrate-binding protein n=1 Tax=unclassified Neisseria TaxID=2623750 RepID=UPI002664F13C|nr:MULTISPECIES: ABC transporter substrate-binding protein [unclassified Neisseria]MDO1510583.1 ABC transporter substrate-binding protein [Neisseria sp. MVDL19-042950]MDO1516293.1 ABC transporter substrate-binding protein [Neisseria sp. MVDL18-041461]MDO1564235.1 ABC transporter substrate-binding protein [Neisseria sp. MVDL20-010259]
MLSVPYRISALAFAAVLLAACNQQESTQQTPVGKSSGNTVTRNNVTEPQSLDPHQITGVPEINVVRDLFEGLVETDEKGAVVPAAAESWESADNRTWTFKLRPDAKWSNGDPVTAEDFVYSWRRLVDPKTASQYASYLQAAQIANINDILKGSKAPDTLGVKALDAHTLQITLTAAVPYFPQMLYHASTKPVHRATVEKYGVKWTQPENFVGNGAYVMKKWVVNERIELAKNTQYRDADNVKIDKVVFLPIGSQTDDVARYEAGEVDISDALPPEMYGKLKEKYPNELKLSPYLCTYYFEINNQKAPFTDGRVRKALSLALDRDTIAAKVLGRGEEAAYNLTRVGTAGFTPYTPEWTKLDYAARVEEAKKLLAEAGYSESKPLKFTFLYNTSEQHKKIAVAAASMWQQSLGFVKVNLENQEWKTYLDNRRSGNYQLARASWCGDYNEPSTFLNTLQSASSSNRAFYKNSQYDAILAKTLQAGVSDEERSKLYRQAEEQIDKDTAIIPVYGYVNSRLVKQRIGGYSTEDVLNELPSKRLFIKE